MRHPTMPQRNSNHKQKAAREGTRFPGISRLAERKGVHRSSLYRFLTGERDAPRLAADREVADYKRRYAESAKQV